MIFSLLLHHHKAENKIWIIEHIQLFLNFISALPRYSSGIPLKIHFRILHGEADDFIYGVIQQLHGLNFRQLWPPTPFEWTFYIRHTLWYVTPLDFLLTPYPPLLVHVVIECPPLIFCNSYCIFSLKINLTINTMIVLSRSISYFCFIFIHIWYKNYEKSTIFLFNCFWSKSSFGSMERWCSGISAPTPKPWRLWNEV